MYWAAGKNVNAEEKFLHIVVWGNCSWLHDDITAYSPHSDWDLYFSCQCFSEDVSFGSGRLCDEHLSLFSVKDWLMLWCCAIYFIYLLSVHSLVDVASFFQPFARRSGLGGSLAAGQIHQTQLAHLLAARLERNHTTERRFIKRDDVKLFWTLQREKLQPVVVWEDLQMIRGSIFAFIWRFCPIPVFMFVLRLIICEDVKKKLQATISSWTEDA